MSKKNDRGTVSPPYPERPVAYTMMGKWGDKARKMSNRGVKLNLKGGEKHPQAHISKTPKRVCTRKELNSVFSLSPSGQSSNHSRASWVKSIKATYVSDCHRGRRSSRVNM